MNRTRPKRYTVYDNKTDFPVIVSGTSRECAKAMGIGMSRFWGILSGQTNKRWFIIKEDEEDD